MYKQTESQTINTTTVQPNEQKTDQPIKWGRGGKRPNQTGRPRKMDEQAIIEKLHPMAESAFKALAEKLAEKDLNAIKLFLSYYLGMPTQRIEGKIEGNLSQINIQVVRPEIINTTTEDTDCHDVTT